MVKKVLDFIIASLAAVNSRRHEVVIAIFNQNDCRHLLYAEKTTNRDQILVLAIYLNLLSFESSLHLEPIRLNFVAMHTVLHRKQRVHVVVSKS